MLDEDSALPPEDVPSDEYERRLPAENPAERWLLFEADRWVVALPLVLGLFAVFLALARVGVIAVTNEGPTTLLLSVLVAGNFTLISIVITINQLVLSREFGKPHTLRERNDGITRFREDVEEMVGRDVAPESPLAFLAMLVGAIDDRADRLAEAVGEPGGSELADEVTTYATAVSDQATDLEETMADTTFGDFDILVAMLFYRIAWQIHAARRIRHQYDDALPSAAGRLLDDLGDLLRALNITRQYVQTLYLQREIAELSRLLLYVGAVAIVLPSLVMLVYTRDAGVTIGPGNVGLAVGAAVAASFVPFSILLAYVIRISTIVSRMPLVSPFISDG